MINIYLIPNMYKIKKDINYIQLLKFINNIKRPELALITEKQNNKNKIIAFIEKDYITTCNNSYIKAFIDFYKKDLKNINKIHTIYTDEDDFTYVMLKIINERYNTKWKINDME